MAKYLWRDAFCIGYPEIDEQHQRMLRMVDENMAALYRGDKVMSIELLEFMNQWLTKHILKSGCQLAQLVR